jgi:hypothetical protein
VAFPRKERAYEKYAWVLLFVVGILTIVDSIGTWGSYANWVGPFNSPDPIVFSSRAAGYGIFILVVLWVGYRRGERWAWYVFWYLPVGIALTFIRVLNGGIPLAWTLPFTFLIISLLGLLLPYRRFFPKKAATGVTTQ